LIQIKNKLFKGCIS